MMLRYPGVMVCLPVHLFWRAGVVYAKCLDGLEILHRTSPFLTDTDWGSDENFSSVPWYGVKHVFAGAMSITGAYI